MDLKTVILLLAVGSFLFGLLLLVFKFNKRIAGSSFLDCSKTTAGCRLHDALLQD